MRCAASPLERFRRTHREASSTIHGSRVLASLHSQKEPRDIAGRIGEHSQLGAARDFGWPQPASSTNIFVPAGATVPGPTVSGEAKFQCCIHPWMRTTVRQDH